MTDIIDRLKRWGVGVSVPLSETQRMTLGVLREDAKDAIAEIETLRERRDGLLVSNNQFEERARVAERQLKQSGVKLNDMLDVGLRPRPISEYHEDMGPVLWWAFPIVEAPYVGSPNDIGYTVQGSVSLESSCGGKVKGDKIRMMVGGWPGYHTHFTPIPMPEKP